MSIPWVGMLILLEFTANNVREPDFLEMFIFVCSVTTHSITHYAHKLKLVIHSLLCAASSNGKKPPLLDIGCNQVIAGEALVPIHLSDR